MESREQFTFYRSYLEGILPMPVERREAVFTAICQYALDGVEPVGLDDWQTSVFNVMLASLKAGRAKAFAALANEESNKNKKKKKTKNKLKNKSKDKCPLKDEAEATFDDFWKEYPKKIGRLQALEVWKAESFNEEEVMEGLKRWKDSKQWEQEDGRFIPRAWRWLKEKHYLDHPQPKECIWGCSGVLGNAELEAIARVMQEG